MNRQKRLPLRGILPFLGLLACQATAAVTDETPNAQQRFFLPVVVACRPEPGDQILEFICRRVQADAPGLASAYGMKLTVEGPVRPGDHWQPPRDTIPLDVILTGTLPASEFAQKEITAQVVAPTFSSADGPWSRSMAATGVARDLVHPVADAILETIDMFLAQRAATPDERN